MKDKDSTMQLFWTPASPFVRKAMVSIHELKLEKRIEIVPTTWPHEWATRTVEFDREFIAANPVGRIPALVTDDGIAICESNLICRYLAAQVGGSRFIPGNTREDLPALRLWGIADGALEAMIARRAETLRTGPEHSKDFIRKQRERISRCFDSFDVSYLESHGQPAIGETTIAHVAAGIACGYMDFRFPSDAWRDNRPALARWYHGFATRESMKLTMPAETPQHR
jgi:glutathione S-transferase